MIASCRYKSARFWRLEWWRQTSDGYEVVLFASPVNELMNTLNLTDRWSVGKQLPRKREFAYTLCLFLDRNGCCEQLIFG